MSVEITLVLLMIFGIIVAYEYEIKMMLKAVKLRMTLDERNSDEERYFAAEGSVSIKESTAQTQNGINGTIGRLLYITLGLKNKRFIPLFWIISVVPAVGVYGFTSGILNSFLCFMLSGMTALMPLIILMMKLQSLRVRSSKEGEILLAEITDNYKINYFNMQQTIEITALTIEEAPNCKRLLFNLSKGVNRAAEDWELKKLLEDFKFAIGTSWAGILTDNMYFALTSGIRVTEALEDLMKTVAKARKVEEVTARENNEAGLILKYLFPISYLLTVLGGIKYFGLTPQKFIYYQFGTEAGLVWFSAALLIYICAVIVKKSLTNRKLDL